MSMTRPAPPTATALGLIGCHVCGLVCQSHEVGRVGACPRCGASLHRRRPDSLARTWALLIAAVILYLPANIVPVMRTVSLFSSTDNTILSGIVELWRVGSPDLAAIVFFASIMVPVLKFIALGWLLISVQRRHAHWPQRQRSRLYRLVENMGYWSMLDVFVVTLLTGAVQLAPFAQVVPLPGIIWFALVVVLTMLASMSFDPRLIWDRGSAMDGKRDD
ncbi:MAG TPA: paraquat-inducible protein A [Rhodanobacteraceae bacterium]